MDPTLDLSLLAALCEKPGLPGFEGPIADFLASHLRTRGIDTRIDRIGNVIAHLPGDGPRAMLIAHMDEVGLLVRKVYAGGFLAVERLGGTSPHVLPGKRVLVWTERGPLPGVMSAIPMHLVADVPQPSLPGMHVDLGVRSQAEAEALGVEVGSPVTYAPSFDRINRCVASKSLDDRLGCFLLLELAARIQAQASRCDLWLVFVVQEENMLDGGVPPASAIQPDWTLGVDATLAFDTPDLFNGQNQVALGAGTVVKVMDRMRATGQGLIAHQGLRKHLEVLAKSAGLPFQREVIIGISTAATPLTFTGTGIPSAAVSFPIRYAHSAIEVADLDDIRVTADLLENAVRSPWEG
jgi:putative aminopeptidase FrvX